MRREPRNPKIDPARVAAGIRSETPDAAAEAAAVSRVRETLGLEHESPSVEGRIERCVGFQSRIPAFVAGTLPSAEALLVEDHTRSCVPCRRALIAARAGATPAPATAATTPSRTGRRLAAAAAIAAIALVGWALSDRFPGGSTPQPLTVLETDGGLWRGEGGESVVLAKGATLPDDRPLRLERGATAVLALADGSRVELREGSAMRVSRDRGGATIHLLRGGLIVEAAPQGRGRLRVSTGDAVATVRGTVFTVNRGLAGSRVSVLEGEVAVRAAGSERTLGPGEQIATGPGVAAVPIRSEVGWSRDSARYDALLADLETLRRDLAATVRPPAPRRGSRLLALVPEDTAFYFAMPNLADALDQAMSVFRSHLERSAILREWWDERVGSREAEAELERGLERVRALGRTLGDEIVVAISADAAGGLRSPLLLADVRDAEGLRVLVEREGIRGDRGFAVRIEGDLAVAGSPEAVASFRAAPTPAAGSSFRERLARVYDDGAGWVFGLDASAFGNADRVPSALFGFEQVVAERTEAGEKTRTAGTLFFDERQGLAGWFDRPGPMTGLEYVSPDAAAAAAVLVRSPREALSELFLRLAKVSPEFPASLGEFQEHTGLDPLEDLARPLGGEFVVALDGPVLPVPAWKVAIEVYDPATLEQAFSTLVERVNERMAKEGKDLRLEIFEETAAGRTYRNFRPVGSTSGVWYAFDRGYLVAGPLRTVVEQAIARRGTGIHLASSSRFRDALPRDARTDYTAVVWQRLSAIGGALPQGVGEALRLDGDGGRALAIWAESDRVEFAIEDDGNLGGDLGVLFSLLAREDSRGR